MVSAQSKELLNWLHAKPLVQNFFPNIKVSGLLYNYK
jgi:hypothetical protein